MFAPIEIVMKFFISAPQADYKSCFTVIEISFRFPIEFQKKKIPEILAAIPVKGIFCNVVPIFFSVYKKRSPLGPSFSELRDPILISVGILKRESIEVFAQIFLGRIPRQIFGDPDRFPKKKFIFDDGWWSPFWRDVVGPNPQKK